MRILAIETSCDETALALIDAQNERAIKTLGSCVQSQANLHNQFGGVYPTLAKREHGRNLVPLLYSLFEQTSIHLQHKQTPQEVLTRIESLLEKKEPDLLAEVKKSLINTSTPPIDAIAVTVGPGLEPALWVGINFARTLSLLWNIPVIPVNHMEGHVLSILSPLHSLAFPAIALLISGGHTEIVHAESLGTYTLLGQTKDDAVGEAFDKVARMLNLPYPGGPHISERADFARKNTITAPQKLPRPMLSTPDYHFSFSGIKTAVLYALKKHTLTEAVVAGFAREFEEAVTEVLIKKTSNALLKTHAKTLIVAGGVSANRYVREMFKMKIELDHPHVTLLFPEHSLATDNAVMIAFAAYISFHRKGEKAFIDSEHLHAQGNLSLHSE